MTEEKRILRASLQDFLETKLTDPRMALDDIPPVLQEVVFHRAEQMGRLSHLRPPFCEEIASLVLDELCQQQFTDLCERLGSTRTRGKALTSLLLVRTQYLAPQVDGIEVLTGSHAIECLQDPDCRDMVRPTDIPAPLLENVTDRIAGLMDSQGQQSGAVTRHRQEGLDMLVDAIWQAYEATVPQVLGVSEPMPPEMPIPCPDHWKALFTQRWHQWQQEDEAPEPDSHQASMQSDPILESVEPTEDNEETAPDQPLEAREEPPQEEELEEEEKVEEDPKSAPAPWPCGQYLFHRIDRLVPRGELLERIKEHLLDRDGPPVIILWGPARAGKTALLHMLCHDNDLQHHFELLLWASLGLEADPSLDADRARQHVHDQLWHWADDLSLTVPRESTLEQLSAAVGDQVGDRQSLALLDEAWSGDSLPPLLLAGKTVVTTRNRALLSGSNAEYSVIAVPPLTFTEARALVRQVTDRNQGENESHLRTLYALTDGSPQAIKTVALRLPELGWERIVDFLAEQTSRLSLLELGEGRSRTDSFRASLALSYERLRPDQQRIFRTLGVLALGPVLAETVHAIGQKSSAAAVELELGRLADLGMVDRVSLPDGKPVFSLSTLWHDYARERLRDSGEFADLEQQHITYHAHQAESLSSHFRVGRKQTHTSVLHFYIHVPQVDDVFRLVAQRRDTDLVYRLLVSCQPLLLHAARSDLWQAWLETLDPWLSQETPQRAIQPLLAEWRLQRAELALRLDRTYGLALDLIRARHLCRRDPVLKARRVLLLAALAQQLGRTRVAQRYVQHVQRKRILQKAPHLRTMLQSLRAQLARENHAPASVRSFHGQAILTCRAFDSPIAELLERLNLAESYRQSGWINHAIEQLLHVATTADEFGLPDLYLTSLTRLGNLYLSIGRVDDAKVVGERLRPFRAAHEAAGFEAQLANTPRVPYESRSDIRLENARRIAIIGPRGSGKTAFARQLSHIRGLPHIELDRLWWPSGWKPVPVTAFRCQTLRALNQEAWIVDGNHWQVRDIVWGRADYLVHMNYSDEQIVLHQLGRLRRWFRDRFNPDVEHPAPETRRTHASFLLQLARAYHQRHRDKLIAYSLPYDEAYAPSVRRIVSDQDGQTCLEFLAQDREHRENLRFL